MPLSPYHPRNPGPVNPNPVNPNPTADPSAPVQPTYPQPGTGGITGPADPWGQGHKASMPGWLRGWGQGMQFPSMYSSLMGYRPQWQNPYGYGSNQPWSQPWYGGYGLGGRFRNQNPYGYGGALQNPMYGGYQPPMDYQMPNNAGPRQTGQPVGSGRAPGPGQMMPLTASNIDMRRQPIGVYNPPTIGGGGMPYTYSQTQPSYAQTGMGLGGNMLQQLMNSDRDRVYPGGNMLEMMRRFGTEISDMGTWYG